MNNTRITETTIYEVRFDLWGFSEGWVESIGKAVSNCYESDDECEQYDVPYCGVEEVVFRSPSLERINKAKAVFSRMSNLAKSTDMGINHNRG